MSAFTDRFNAVLAHNVYSIAAVCRASGVDRTTIQKLKAGTRHPPRQVLEAFLDSAQIGLTDRTELLRLYEIEEIGASKYCSRRSIRSLFNQIALLDDQLNQLAAVPASDVPAALPRQDMQLINGFVAIDIFVHQWLNTVLLSGQSLQIFMPFTNEDFFRYLFHLSLAHPGSSITHILNFEQRSDLPENTAKNLNTLSQVLPFSFLNPEDYAPYYFYCDTSAVDDRFVVMPYYCLSEDSMLLFSSDFSHMIVYQTKDILKLYRSHFQTVLRCAHPLVNRTQQPGSAIENYVENAGNVLELSASLEAPPCFSKMITPEIVGRYLAPDLPDRDSMVELVTSIYEPVRVSGQHFASFFTEKGLYQFASTGRVGYFPPGSALPFSPEDRIDFITQVRTSVSEGLREFFMIRGNRLKVSDSVVCEFYADGRLLFLYQSDQHCSVVQISESSIYSAFLDFFTALPDSSLVCSREETLDILDQCIRLVSAAPEPMPPSL